MTPFDEKFMELSYEEREAIRNTAGWKIFNKLYEVGIPKYEAVDENEVRSRGSFTTRDSMIDDYTAKKEVLVHRTIAQLVKIWENGSPIRFTNHEKVTREISEIIQSHLEDSRIYIAKIQHGMQTIDKEHINRLLSDLEDLDAFGKDIFQHTRNYIPDEMVGRDDIFNDMGALFEGKKERLERQRQIQYTEFGKTVDLRALRSTRRYRN